MSEMERKQDALIDERQRPDQRQPDHPPSPRDQREPVGARMSERERDTETNPEVMGRTEPREMPGRKGGPPESGMPRSDDREMWPEMDRYTERMKEIQSEFIDDPRAAIKKAEQLIDEAVDYMARAMHERVQQMHGDAASDADTEKLRLILSRYSHFIERMDGRRAA